MGERDDPAVGLDAGEYGLGAQRPDDARRPRCWNAPDVQRGGDEARLRRSQRRREASAGNRKLDEEGGAGTRRRTDRRGRMGEARRSRAGRDC
jgi:hypothetical protein